jgi:hypothetical protein
LLAGEEPEMTPFFLALAVACVVFWRVALRILVIGTVFLVISGGILVLQDLHHIR